MVSKNTNVSAIMALQNIRRAIDSRNESEDRISSGYRVAKAADNAAYWSIATTMRSDNHAIGAVQDALNMASGVLDTAENGMTKAVDLMSQAKSRLVLAREPGVDRSKINTELDEIRSQLRSIATGSSFSEQNWLWRSSSSDPANRNLVGSFVRNSSGQISINTINYDIGGQSGTEDVNYLIDDVGGDDGILTGPGFASTLGTAKTWVMFNGASAGTSYDEIKLDKNTSNTDIDDMIKVVDAMTGRITDVASTLGALSNRVHMQNNFAKNLEGTIKTGIGRLVDTDMDSESSRLKALQTRQQLAESTLPIINGNINSVLQLLQ
ncbi:flagellin [Allorhizobium sp. BGMRC 0089]|uniref:flagellin N-terminal helical domain-containing protein n=1 Tax=Allorhizobium sonneratiae TaxID=2934936 RepID=UPI0020335CCD|nr:flagellin [Allorhizobium sonneratiae]MCM2291811.1 flagellin [Allorhizobium sonneratiae]